MNIIVLELKLKPLKPLKQLKQLKQFKQQTGFANSTFLFI